FFLIGIAIPVYFFGFSGDGPPEIGSLQNTYSPGPAAAPEPSFQRSSRGYGVVGFVRSFFERTVDNWVSPSVSPLMVKLGLIVVLFGGGFFLVRLVIGLISGALGSFFGFLVHKAAGPMFMGFLAVGSTWGIHETVAREYGMGWAAATVCITAAIATLFA